MATTISASVGKGGINRRPDVEIVQTLINRKARSLAPLRPLRIDGVVGPRTIAAIEAYQRNVLADKEPDGLVDINGRTIRSLRGAATGAAAIPYGSRQVVEPTTTWVNIAAQEATWMGFADAERGVTEKKGFLKGGSWNYDPMGALTVGVKESTLRSGEEREPDIGFRCAR